MAPWWVRCSVTAAVLSLRCLAGGRILVMLSPGRILLRRSSLVIHIDADCFVGQCGRSLRQPPPPPIPPQFPPIPPIQPWPPHARECLPSRLSRPSRNPSQPAQCSADGSPPPGPHRTSLRLSSRNTDQGDDACILISERSQQYIPLGLRVLRPCWSNGQLDRCSKWPTGLWRKADITT
jgi:hypothetical protein